MHKPEQKSYKKQQMPKQGTLSLKEKLLLFLYELIKV